MQLIFEQILEDMRNVFTFIPLSHANFMNLALFSDDGRVKGKTKKRKYLISRMIYSIYYV